MIECTGCNKMVHPVQVMDGSMRMETRCPDETCNARLSVDEDSVKRGQPAAAKSQPSPQPNILDMAKSRLAVVDGEIAKLRSLEQEQAMLRRMIAAADGSKKN